MTAVQQLEMISAEFAKQRHAIDQLTLSGWLALAAELGVEQNDRDHAAKILAIRSLKRAGKLQ